MIIKSPDNVNMFPNIPLFGKISKIVMKSINSSKIVNKVFLNLFFLLILVSGTIFCELNNFFSILLFFNKIEEFNFGFFYSLSFIINFFIFYLIIEGIIRLFYRKKRGLATLSMHTLASPKPLWSKSSLAN